MSTLATLTPDQAAAYWANRRQIAADERDDLLRLEAASLAAELRLPLRVRS